MPLILKIIIAAAIVFGLAQLMGLKDTLNQTVHENDRTFGEINIIEDNSTK